MIVLSTTFLSHIGPKLLWGPPSFIKLHNYLKETAQTAHKYLHKHDLSLPFQKRNMALPPRHLLSLFFVPLMFLHNFFFMVDALSI